MSVALRERGRASKSRGTDFAYPRLKSQREIHGNHSFKWRGRSRPATALVLQVLDAAIIAAARATPAPLVLLGLQEGQNFFVKEDGNWQEGVYVPAYIRRYPFMLARLRQESEDLSLCFDDTCDEIGEGKEQAFFDGTEPSQVTKNVLNFCEEYEKSIQRTRAFVQELSTQELLMDGEVSIQPPGDSKPSIYRGFQMVNEEKLKELRGDQARKLIQNGALPLVYAHLLSVQIIRELFAKGTPVPETPLSVPTDDGTVTNG